MAWSYDLLDDTEKTVLQRCSVFAGGFDLQSACTVAGSGDLDEYAVLEVLDALVRKSLLIADRSSERTRFSMLETIRQFAEEQLVASGEAMNVRSAQSRYFAGREADVLPLRDSPSQREGQAYGEEPYPTWRPSRDWGQSWKYAALTMTAALLIVVGIVIVDAVLTWQHHSTPSASHTASSWPENYTNPPTPTYMPPTVTVPPSTVTVSPSPTYTPPSSAYTPPPTSYPSSSCSTLHEQARIDAPVIAAQAVGYWLPQISSKQPGLHAEGRIWDCAAIWTEHASMRTSYNAKLMYSGDWPATFKRADFWVTIAGTTYATQSDAQGWCYLHNMDADHCFPVSIKG